MGSNRRLRSADSYGKERAEAPPHPVPLPRWGRGCPQGEGGCAHLQDAGTTQKLFQETQLRQDSGAATSAPLPIRWGEGWSERNRKRVCRSPASCFSAAL